MRLEGCRSVACMPPDLERIPLRLGVETGNDPLDIDANSLAEYGFSF